MEVLFTEKVLVRDCRCGRDGTMLLTDVRSVLACGSNEHNKLGMNQRQGFLMSMKNMFNKVITPDVIRTVLISFIRFIIYVLNKSRPRTTDYSRTPVNVL